MKPRTNPLEKREEQRSVELAESYRYLSFKLDKYKRSDPDRLFIGPKLSDGSRDIFFVEFKRKGEKPRPQQAHRLKVISSWLDIPSLTFDSFSAFEAFFLLRVS